MSYGKKILKASDVMDGVASMIHEVGVEVGFPDGTKLVTVHTPIEDNGKLTPGEYILKNEDIEINKGKKAIDLKITNKGDRAVQVGSHFHFFEVNKLLEFDREKAYGKRLDIASGTSVRFEPGETKTVSLIEIGGHKRVFGFNDLANSQINEDNKKQAMQNAKAKGFSK